MSFSKNLINDKRVKRFYKEYMKHPFIQGLKDGTLSREKFKNYLIQDSLYLKDYAKVYAHAFLLTDKIKDLQFLHSCIGVVVADETNMHTRYLKDFGLDVYKVDDMEIKHQNRSYLNFMLSFAKGGDIKEIFVSAFPCTLTYEYIGVELKKSCANLEENYYSNWIKAYGGKEFREFSEKSCELIDRLCIGINEEEEEKLIEIFLKSCEHEMNFWDMSFE